jgi:peptidoglycan/xylan/chitin deacetylase (PgdA/CDA1 family)
MIAGTIQGIQQAALKLRRKFASKGIILLYHRVAEKDVDPWSLGVTPQHFAEQLEVVRRLAKPMSLKELLQFHQAGSIPDRAVAVTFDDGYANNLYNAKPLLEQYDIPATVFIAAGSIDKNREYWWDELDQVLLQPGRLPDQLDLQINDSAHHWEVGAAVNYSEDERSADFDNRTRQKRPSPRLAFYFSVWEHLQPLLETQRQKALDDVITWSGITPFARPAYRPLTLAEVHTLEQGGPLEVGAHTMSHPVLSIQSIAVQHEEIQRSKAVLEEALHHPISSFAYPHGAYTRETMALVRAAGFSCACSTVKAVVWRESDRFQLPRCDGKDWGGEEFERQLFTWFQL